MRRHERSVSVGQTSRPRALPTSAVDAALAVLLIPACKKQINSIEYLKEYPLNISIYLITATACQPLRSVLIIFDNGGILVNTNQELQGGLIK